MYRYVSCMSDELYEYPYPSEELAAQHPFVTYSPERLGVDEMRRRADDFYALMDSRRSIRLFSDDPVPVELIERAVATAATAPSGAHKQPWTFVATNSADVKAAIREAAEEEERTNYLDNRMNAEWQETLAPLGTDWHKEFLEVAPWIVVLFEQRYELRPDGETRKNYYVKESCGIAAGMFIAALHTMACPHSRTHPAQWRSWPRCLSARRTSERSCCSQSDIRCRAHGCPIWLANPSTTFE